MLALGMAAFSVTRGAHASPENCPTLGQLDRLRLIVKAFRDCEQEPVRDDVAWQYRYETGEDMDDVLYERVMR